VGDVYLRFEAHMEDLLLEELPDVPLLTHLEVVEPLRNRGIGTALLQRSERVLSARGFRMVVLGVHPENKDAIRLYERFGYRAYPEENRVISTVACRWDDAGAYHEEEEECVIFVKDLSTPAGEQVGDQ
jgi:GNAT superfamily N-acetyltransferase